MARHFALLGGMVLDAVDLVAEAECLVDLIECVPEIRDRAEWHAGSLKTGGCRNW